MLDLQLLRATAPLPVCATPSARAAPTATGAMGRAVVFHGVPTHRRLGDIGSSLRLEEKVGLRPCGC